MLRAWLGRVGKAGGDEGCGALRAAIAPRFRTGPIAPSIRRTGNQSGGVLERE
ncbi:hypothetical protein [Acetobacter thailandicus]|uniref:Uncharacterized protein n=1 Tax=Acetobacter thailandicus TaxID=1502842 RepID=A0ABT3QCK2_9PROT|nr:hypothetical protein [Acetobacter thailandicus]MCX2563017.1 hypothetical protein [Acetobacter thailandicus]NHN96153.1 hypothetical protein [Acetobacter thailandicus]